MTTDQMSDTPRTDAVEGYDDEYSNPELLALCRQLERELNASKEHDQIANILSTVSDTPETDAFLTAKNCTRDNPVAFDWLVGFARSLERKAANAYKGYQACNDDLIKCDEEVMRWFKAASPYATPGSLEEGLKDVERFRILSEYVAAIIWKKDSDLPPLGHLKSGFSIDDLRSWCDGAKK